MTKEKVFAWIESLEDMADQSDRYFVERTELYKENQAKDKEIQRLTNIIKNKDKIIKAAIRKLRAAAKHYNLEGKNNAINHTLNILKEGK